MTSPLNVLHRVGRALDWGQRWLRFRIGVSPLNPRRIATLHPHMFRGKRVVIIGPAETVMDDLSGVDVDAFDVVVRLNNGIALSQQRPAALGSRTDILFHNLKEDGERSAGRIPEQFLREHGIRFCVFPHGGFKGNKTRLHEKRRELGAYAQIVLRVPPTDLCERMRRDLGGMLPTVGTSAILFFLAGDVGELAIYGFSFFETPYLAGYNDVIATGASALAWAAASQVHEPSREKRLIARRIAEAERSGIRVTLGRNVRRHLEG
ncbi:hypothetical protein [Pararhizobium gei]|uniref:hypothetical protein n=1 Tax=Pararhizobium gei TaxID=1395951 RepID=UPI0023DAE519|nr:hypothetical protein [Rhizobium gei]